MSLHLPVCRCSQEVCVSERTWKTLWIYVILQAIRLSRALLNMTWSVPAPEQTLLSPWPARAVTSWSGSWDLTAVAFPKQISSAFGNAVRPHDLAPAKKREQERLLLMLRLIHSWACVCLFTGLLPWVCVCLSRFSLFSPHLIERPCLSLFPDVLLFALHSQLLRKLVGHIIHKKVLLCLSTLSFSNQ